MSAGSDAKIEDIKLIKKVVGATLKIKPPAELETQKPQKKYIALVVDRIGNSSGIQIVSG